MVNINQNKQARNNLTANNSYANLRKSDNTAVLAHRGAKNL